MDTKKILVVEDDQVTATLLDSILKSQGYDVVIAHNGKMALSLMAGMMPDLIISDVVMPEMNGYDFYKHVKKNSAASNIPFIILTEHNEIGEVFSGFDVDDCFEKPVNTEKLLHKINILITHGRATYESSSAAKSSSSKHSKVAMLFWLPVLGVIVLFTIFLSIFISSHWKGIKLNQSMDGNEQEISDSFE